MTATNPNDLKSDAAEDESTATSIHVNGEETATEQPVELSAEDVRQGHTGDHLRGILILSVIGAVFAMPVLFMIMRP